MAARLPLPFAAKAVFMSLDELEAALSSAQLRLEIAAKALAPKHKGGEIEEYWSAHALVLDLERKLAAAKGKQYAVPIDFPVQWDVGAPLPHLLQNDYKTFLLFLLRDVDPRWDGTTVTSKSPADTAAKGIAIIEFKRCMATMMGTPNDEVLHGHPLHGHGLVSYTAQRVINSEWIETLRSINSVHHCYRPDFWKSLNHYVLWFHDCSFECVAESFDLQTVDSNIGDVLATLCARLIE